MIDSLFEKRKILITCGTGGVGKTSLSSAIALRAALIGKNAVVITIDPAKRLKTSLGVKTLGDDPTDLTPLLPKGPPGPPKGELHAIVPDTQRTFETFVHELSPNEMVTRRILANPIFQLFSKEFSGANEYMALEKLLTIHELNRFDLIVLDTPPSRNTLDFLDAPGLLSQFFDDSLFKWLVPSANKLLSGGMKKALGLLENLAGGGFMKNLVDFAIDIMEVREKFTKNLGRVTTLLSSHDVGFLMVAQANAQTLHEAKEFVSTLRSRKFNFDGVIINRSLSHLKTEAKPDVPADSQIQSGISLLTQLQAREAPVLDSLRVSQIPLLGILPELSRDVHNLEDLTHVSMAFGALPS